MKNKLTYYALMIFIVLNILIPYKVNNIFGFIPIRVLLEMMVIGAHILERIITKKEYRKTKKTPMIIFSIFILVCSITLFITTSYLTTIYTIIKFMLSGILIYVIYSSNFKKEEYINLIKVFIFAASCALLYGIITYIFNIDLNMNGVYKYDGAVGRVGATFHQPSYFGIFCVMYYIVLAYLFINKNIINKYFVLISLLICTINILMTYTRSVYLLLFGSLGLIFIINIRKIKEIYLKYIILGLIFIISIVVTPGSYYVYESSFNELMPDFITHSSNTNTDSEEETELILDLDGDYILIYKNCKEVDRLKCERIQTDTSLLTRREFKKLSKRIIKDNFYLGVGFGNYENYLSIKENKEKYIEYKFGYPHNAYLHIMSETGIIGLIGFAILLLSIGIYYIIKFIRTNEKINLYMFTMWICIVLFCFYESFFYNSQILPIYVFINAMFILFFNKEEKTDKKNVMFISSVGGHLTQLLNLKGIFEDYNYILITERNDVTKNMKETYKMDYLMYGSRNYPLKYIPVIIFNIIKSIYMFIKYNPETIVTTGTHTAVPMCYLGWLFRKKVIFIESFAKSKSPTLSGKLVYPIATTFIVQWESMLEFYPKAKYFGGIY